MEFYRVYYRKETPGAAVVHGAIDITEHEVETVHRGSVDTALVSMAELGTWDLVTGWEKLSS